MIDLKHEIERELSRIDPPDLWDRIQADATNDVLDLTPGPHRWRPSPWLAVAAVTVLLALVGGWTLLDDDQTVDTTPATEGPEVPEPPIDDDDSTTLARGVDVEIGEIGGLGGLTGQTLNVDAEEQDGEVTGEFRIDDVVVTLQCADTRISTGSAPDRRDLILGGTVTANPDGISMLDAVMVAGGDPLAVNVGVGEYVALIIREDAPGSPRQRVTLYHPSLWHGEEATAGSCDELVESVPENLDGGFFDDVGVGAIDLAEIEAADDGPTTLARGEDVETGGFGDRWIDDRTLNVEAVEQDGEVTGEFRLDDVLVTLQCADTDTIAGEIRLGGVVAADPDGQGVTAGEGGHVAVGERLALIIRERGPDFDMVTLFADASAGSCAELVAAVPYNLDGGFFNDIQDGDAIETGGVNFNP